MLIRFCRESKLKSKEQTIIIIIIYLLMKMAQPSCWSNNHLRERKRCQKRIQSYIRYYKYLETHQGITNHKFNLGAYLNLLIKTSTRAKFFTRTETFRYQRHLPTHMFGFVIILCLRPVLLTGYSKGPYIGKQNMFIAYKV